MNGKAKYYVWYWPVLIFNQLLIAFTIITKDPDIAKGIFIWAKAH